MSLPARILVADDDRTSRRIISLILTKAGYEVVQAKDGNEAIEKVDETISLVLLDVMMPGKSGYDALSRICDNYPGLPIIMISGLGKVDDVIASVRQGAYWYLHKPIDAKELLLIVEKALERYSLFQKNNSLQQLVSSSDSQKVFVGHSETSRHLLEQAKTVAQINSTLLITGESGTGKSMLARLIHDSSDRREQPFVAVNCAAIPRELLESELFGHEKGAFTGATESRSGRIEAADGGTLLLDEIGDLPLELQPKLLSFLQDRTVRRVGSNRERQVNVRIIAATLQSLHRMVEQKLFREDLLYRLGVIGLEIPPLRKRTEDIPLLAHSILRKIAARNGKDAPYLERDAIVKLQQHHWRGNIRELENTLEKAIVFNNTGNIAGEDLNLTCGFSPETLATTESIESNKEFAAMSLAEIERMALERTLALVEGNRAAAARILEISERSVYNKIKRYGLEA